VPTQHDRDLGHGKGSTVGHDHDHDRHSADRKLDDDVDWDKASAGF